jgi:creatinine amidohydrolase
MAGRPYILAETNWKAVRDTKYDVAILPWGATEAHNYHLPYGTDVIETEAIAAESARRAWDRGARVLALPCIPFGVNTGQLDIPFCMNMNPSTQAAVLTDVAAVLDAHGVGKLVILNGHGGNDFRLMIRELQPKVRLFLCTVNWYTSLDARTFFTEPGDHAGEMETSLVQHLTPELVLPLSDAGDGHARRFTVAALRDGWAWAPRRWTKVTDDTGTGTPHASAPDKGARYLDAVAERLAGFYVELAAADPEHLYA